MKHLTDQSSLPPADAEKKYCKKEIEEIQRETFLIAE